MSALQNDRLNLQTFSLDTENSSPAGPIKRKTTKKSIRVRTSHVLDSLANQPQDLSYNLNEWFHGDMSDFRPSRGCSGKDNRLAPVLLDASVSGSNMKSVSDLKFLTEDLSKQSPSSLSIIKTYSVAIDENLNGSEGDSRKVLNFVMDSRNILIDRRPLLRSQLKNAKTDQDKKNLKYLITREQDCDESTQEDKPESKDELTKV